VQKKKTCREGLQILINDEKSSEPMKLIKYCKCSLSRKCIHSGVVKVCKLIQNQIIEVKDLTSMIRHLILFRLKSFSLDCENFVSIPNKYSMKPHPLDFFIVCFKYLPFYIHFSFLNR